jgi:addiction module RelE/StbE family toxin
MYKVRYLPRALKDLEEIFRYISRELKAPKAAENLLDRIDKAVAALAANPFRHHLFISPKKLSLEYRVLPVNNFSVFYVVEKQSVEIHRVLYSRRDKDTLL